MFLGYGITSRGQATDIKKGDQAYEKKNYPEAILSYEKAFEKYGNKPVHNSGFIYKLANSYRFTNQYEKAIKYYNLIKENKSFPDAKMLLSDMLLRTGNINEARKELSTIPEITELIVNKEKKELIALQEKQGMTSTEGKNDQALLLLKNCYFADSCQKINNPEVTVQNIVTVNSKGSDFGLARLSEDTILFASNRISTEKSIVEGINYQPYTDFYTA